MVVVVVVVVVVVMMIVMMVVVMMVMPIMILIMTMLMQARAAESTREWKRAALPRTTTHWQLVPPSAPLWNLPVECA